MLLWVFFFVYLCVSSYLSFATFSYGRLQKALDLGAIEIVYGYFWDGWGILRKISGGYSSPLFSGNASGFPDSGFLPVQSENLVKQRNPIVARILIDVESHVGLTCSAPI